MVSSKQQILNNISDLEERLTLKDIRKNEKFYWCEYGKCIVYRALEEARAIENGYVMTASKGTTFTFLFEVYEDDPREDYPKGYALRIFRRVPQGYTVEE